MFGRAITNMSINIGNRMNRIGRSIHDSTTGCPMRCYNYCCCGNRGIEDEYSSL